MSNLGITQEAAGCRVEVSDLDGEFSRQVIVAALRRWDNTGDGTISGSRLRRFLSDAGVPEAHLPAIFSRAGLNMDDDQLDYVDFTGWLFTTAPPALRDMLLVALRPEPCDDADATDAGLHAPVDEMAPEDQAQQLLDAMDLTATLPRGRVLPEEEVQQMLEELNLTFCVTPKSAASLGLC
uniref:Calmodulin n=1 Tax=Pyrodinium bahamense TaxID=73915 RepID=A0A7S0AN14_9DINO